MLNRPRDKIKTDVEAGKKAANKDLMYRYPVYIEKPIMQDYIAICKRRGTTACAELVKYIERQTQAFEDKLPS